MLHTLAPVDTPVVFTGTELKSAVVNALKRSSITQDHRGWHLHLPTEDLGKTYAQVKTVIERLRGGWNGKSHLFMYDPSQRIAEVIAAGKMPKNNPYSLHCTPPDVASMMVDWADIPSDRAVKVIEPSAGTGALVDAIWKTHPYARIHAWEFDPFNLDVLKAKYPALAIRGTDWRQSDEDGTADFVIMNPEFRGSAWVKHVGLGLKALKETGTLISVVPAHPFLTIGGNNLEIDRLRNIVAMTGGWESVGRAFSSAASIECLVIKAERPTSELEAMFVERSVQAWDISLSSDRDWYETYTRIHPSNPHFEDDMRIAVGLAAQRLYREGASFAGWSLQIQKLLTEEFCGRQRSTE